MVIMHSSRTPNRCWAPVRPMPTEAMVASSYSSAAVRAAAARSRARSTASGLVSSRRTALKASRSASVCSHGST